ncbi:MAG: radical SAM protein [Chloroflexi bacterium]|nr:radical SAM protein [Chloroflexota bacterium]
MKIYVLNPPYLPGFVRFSRHQGGVARGSEFYYPIWLAYAAGALEQDKHDVRLVDAPAWGWDRETVLEDARKFSPDLAIIDTIFGSLTNDITVAELLKKNISNLRTILVGPPASQFAERMLQNGGVDLVARLEYDSTVKEVARALEEGRDFKDIKGLSYKRDGKTVHNPNREFMTSEELDKLPFVSEVYKRHLRIKDYFLSHSLYPMAQLFTGRGCPFQCTFCSWPETLMGRRYRARSVENVIAEFEYIRAELPEVKEVFIEDDTFTADKNRVKEFCRQMKARRLNLPWACDARANLDYETMREMKDAGCRLLDVGYESGSDAILKNVKKGITTDQMRKFARDARRAGLMIMADFVIGLPGETKETAEKTIRFASELKPNVLQYESPIPIPGTEYYRWAKENGFLLVDDLEKSLDREGFKSCIVSYPHFTAQEMVEYVDKGLKSYYLSPSYIPIAMSMVFRKGGLHELKGLVRSAIGFFRYLRRNKWHLVT